MVRNEAKTAKAKHKQTKKEATLYTVPVLNSWCVCGQGGWVGGGCDHARNAPALDLFDKVALDRAGHSKPECLPRARLVEDHLDRCGVLDRGQWRPGRLTQLLDHQPQISDCIAR